MTSNEIRSALQLSALLAENAACPLDSGLTPDQAIADLKAALDASLNGTDPDPTTPAPSAPVTARVRAAMAANCFYTPSVGEMAEMVRERTASLTDAGTVWAVWHRKDDGSLVLCEFDGCVCYEAYRTLEEAVRAAGQANDGFCGGYVAALMPAGLACCIDGEFLRTGGGDFEWMPFLDAGFICVRVAAPNIAFDPAA